MGLLDRFLPKTPARPTPAPSTRLPEEHSGSEPAPVAGVPVQLPAPETTPPAAPAIPVAPSAGGVLTRLKDAREALALKDRAGALAIYEEVLAIAGDRADVLVSISGDQAVKGHTREIVDLVAPRYEGERHGPATGVTLLQAYLALCDPEAAQ